MMTNSLGVSLKSKSYGVVSCWSQDLDSCFYCYLSKDHQSIKLHTLDSRILLLVCLFSQASLV